MRDAPSLPQSLMLEPTRYRELRRAVAERDGLWPLCVSKCLTGEQSLHIVKPVPAASA